MQQQIPIRAQVHTKLLAVALPDSRFHYDFSSFIPDFAASAAATARVALLPAYNSCTTLFIAPDNCLESLRLAALRDGKSVLTTSYGIRRGFFLLDPTRIAPEKWEMACLLDGAERFAESVTLRDLLRLAPRVGLCATGTGAICAASGLRVGKGHGFFDLEWGLLFSLGLVGRGTPSVAVAHDCQVIGEDVVANEWDTACDYIATPGGLREVSGARKPECGILWGSLEDGLLEGIPPLRELRALTDAGIVVQPERQ